MDGPDRTQGLGTDTALGWIPHKRWRGLDCPVKLIALRWGDGHVLDMDDGSKPRPYPMRTGWGAFIYALPGGGELV